MSNPRLPLRLLITTPNLDTAGSKYVIADIIKNLDKSLIKPSLCVHRRTFTDLEEQLASRVEEIIEVPLRVASRPYLTLFQRVRTFSKLFKDRFDLIHSFDYADSWTEGLIAQNANIPWIYQKTNMNWGRKSWWLKSRLAKSIVCYSNAQYRELFESSQFKDKVTVINIGVDFSRFDFRPTNRDNLSEQRKSLDIPPDSIVLGCVAHLVPVKGHPELLKAFATVVSEISNFYLVLVGDGDAQYVSELHNLTSRLGIEENVRYLGLRTDVPRLLPIFDGLILATRSWGRKEAFGAVLVEAMAAELPVIATKSGGPEDIIVPDETGWLVDAEGEEPLASAMKAFVIDNNRRQRFGAAGYKRARDLFSVEMMTEHYQKLYLETAKDSL
jgi:glycosyltransferase involved in cell wall biosynthesis